MEKRQAASMVIRAARQPIHTSPLYKWMSEHYDELVAEMPARRPNWAAMTRELTQLGLLNSKGGELNPKDVRQVWLRVNARRPSAGSVSRETPGAPAVVLPDAAPAPRQKKYDFRPAQINRSEDKG